MHRGAARPRIATAASAAVSSLAIGAFGAAIAAVAGVALGSLASGCGDYGPVTLADQDAGAAGLRPHGVGEACDDAVRCRSGLTCTDEKCVPSHALEDGAACTISAECKDGLYCGPSRTCSRGGVRAAGDTCGSEADCGAHLRCNAIGLSAECAAEGAVDLDSACKLSPECFGGLLCIAGKCAAPPATSGAPPVAVSSFPGVTCQDEPGGVRAYFRVPRGKDDGDFFRLPFPNDVRKKAGKVDLTGFPTPGNDVLGYDLVDRYARYVEETASGFSAYPTMIMRFSATPDLNTLKPAGVLRFVDLTAGGAGEDVGFGWSAGSARTKYVCANAIVARPAPGLPLQPGHTYALFVTNSAKGPGGTAIEVSPDLTALLGASDPGAPLSDAWSAYAPLRTWATTKSFDLNTLVNAAVFTVGKHTDVVAKLASAALAAPAPAVTGWVRCGAAPSPCPQAQGTRACGAVDPAFDELHALVTLPLWQKGTAPYTAATDGDVVTDPNGTPVTQGTSQVCLALTVPKGTMPATGWPLAIYAHDTGGSFRSHVTDGVAARLSAADGGAAKLAVLGIDQVAHGTRRGASTAKPGALWFATSNPRAMRGNALQAAADLLALARLAPALMLPAGTSPTGAEIRFGDVVLVGHGQGATAATLAAPRTAAKAVVLGGIGSSFVDAVVSKRNPVDFVDVAPAVLGEVTLTTSHPVLAMFQNALDPSDPLDHASLLVTSPPTSPKHAFAVYGRGDTFTPGLMQATYTVAAGFGIASPPSTVGSPDNIGAPILPVPAGGNYAGGDISAIVRQYDRGSYDGHLVMLLSSEATHDEDRFIADVVLGKVPLVGR